jgi:hypothetical protein
LYTHQCMVAKIVCYNVSLKSALFSCLYAIPRFKPNPQQRLDPQALRQRLYDDSGIEVPVTSHRGQVFVRVSVQGYTSSAEVQRLLNAPALAG